MNSKYTTQLHAGIGMMEETITLLDIWQPDQVDNDLYEIALESGLFPNMSARRIRNLIKECFYPRYLVNDLYPAFLLKSVKSKISNIELVQLFFLFTCRDNLILRDFVNQVYWPAYIAGRNFITNEDARKFVSQAVQDEKTTSIWSEGTIQRVARYLTSSCSDFGLLERGTKQKREILNFRIEPRTVFYLSHELHFSGLGDNSIIHHSDWRLFGMDAEDVIEELKKLMLKDALIFQSAGGVSKISWKYKSLEELEDVISYSRF